ncbi:polysaccharide pyruvyl transferase family protein [Agromyces sp. NPDC058110]|uniref:polysaccharide pyruvyl transferase family protein n=1 Tax=Agromyces sp. NPDC058110 TaxID=3346345 RepID=UPI0036DD8EB7
MDGRHRAGRKPSPSRSGRRSEHSDGRSGFEQGCAPVSANAVAETTGHVAETPTTAVHVWLSGQADNVGDSVLRRVYANELRSAGRLVVWAGDPRSGYAAGLRLHPDEASPGFLSWWLSVARAAVGRGGIFAFNAGEFVPTRRYFAGVVSLLPLLAVHRMRGGRIVWVGAGVRRTLPGFTWPFALLAQWSDLLLWRDARSVELMGRGGTMPDWAFGSGQPAVVQADDGARSLPGTTGAPGRDLLAVSLRGDRPAPSERWVEAVRGLAHRLGLTPIVVVQVKRDATAAHDLAGRLDAEAAEWATDDHWAQELRVRDVYRRSRVVLSDRLHALVMGATEGAVPLGWCESSNEKIARHFDQIGASWVGADARDPTERLGELDRDRLDDLGVATVAIVDDARGQLADVGRRLAEIGAVRR